VDEKMDESGWKWTKVVLKYVDGSYQKNG